MPNPEIDLLAFGCGSITAPAGCGKTQLITDTLKLNHFGKPVLLLTHTNAGVGALRARLKLAGVNPSIYRVSTIDGWVMRLIATFPSRSQHDPEILKLKSKTDYASIRDAAWGLLASGHVFDALQSTYSRVFVDEYQDCTLPQHQIIAWLATALPTCVLGDPLQAIFGFNEPLVNWEKDVFGYFPSAGHLSTPWRWRNVQNEPLGQWLLQIRTSLKTRQAIDLRSAPPQVQWIAIEAATAHEQRLEAARVKTASIDHQVLVIGDSQNPRGQRKIASQTLGAVTVEAADLKDLTAFGRAFNPGSPDALNVLLTFAQGLMTNLDVALYIRRIGSLSTGKAHNPATEAEQFGMSFMTTPNFESALLLLGALRDQPDVRVYRPEILRHCKKALSLASEGSITFEDATVSIREQNRYVGRPMSRRSVGSTLLLKGLEADIAVILNPEEMDANHLYVALTRGARQVVVCSSTPILRPRAK
jgi:DNA helicase-2/ATP-dependent DNA helicase PcrA